MKNKLVNPLTQTFNERGASSFWRSQLLLLGFYVKRTWGLHYFSVISLVLLASGLLSGCGPSAREQREISEQKAFADKQIEENNIKQLKENERISQEQRKIEYCTSAIEEMKEKALKAKKEKKHKEVVEILAPCYGVIADADALQLYLNSRELLKVAERDKAAVVARRSGVSLGMTKDEVLASSWGHPHKINKSHNSFGSNEQWVYGGGYLYFENGVLSSVQN